MAAVDEYHHWCVYDSFFLVNIILSASPAWGHYRCKSQTRRGFMTPVPVFQDGPGKCPTEDLQIKMEKQGMGGQVGPLSCQCCPSSAFPPLFSRSRLCHLRSHQSFSSPHPSPPLTVSVLDEDIAPHLCRILQRLLLSVDGCLGRV